MTRNGVLIDRDFIDGAGEDIVPFIPADWVNSDANYSDRVYSIANVYDIRLEGVKTIDDPKMAGKPTLFDFTKILKNFAEK
jgi:hypothetical protein